MDVLGGRPAGSSGQPDRVAGFDDVVHPDEIPGLVRIDGLDAVVMPDHDEVAVSAVRFRHPHDARHRGPDRVVRDRLDVDTGVVRTSASPERGDQFSRIRITEFRLQLAQRNAQFARFGERIVITQRDADVRAFGFAETHLRSRLQRFDHRFRTFYARNCAHVVIGF